MKAVVKNLLREIISFYFILRYGNPTKILRLLGGIGDHLLLTIIAKEIKKKNSLSNIWIISNSKDLYENNSNISGVINLKCCLLYTSPSPRDRTRSRMPSSA